MSKIYKCDCGREFISAQAFNGHKSHCVIHLNLTNNLSKRINIDKTNGCKSAIKLSQYYKNKRESKLKIWLNEQHKCEKCGKIMTEKFGSGRFCSRVCANSHSLSKESKEKIRDKLKIKVSNENKTHIKAVNAYNKNPKYCVICNKKLEYDYRYRKTCSDNCYKILLHDISLQAVILRNGNLNIANRFNYKHGFFNGIHYDSSWELALLIYCRDHGIIINRCKEYFNYTYDGKNHKYFPDFKIDNIYIEVKNYCSDVVKAKIACFPKDKQLVVLYEEAMLKYLNYCKDNYGNNFYDNVK